MAVTSDPVFDLNAGVQTTLQKLERHFAKMLLFSQLFGLI